MKKGIKIFLGMYLSICMFFVCAMFNLTELGIAIKIIVTSLFVLFLFFEDDLVFEKNILSIIAVIYNLGLLFDARIPQQYKILNFVCAMVIIVAVYHYFLTKNA